MPCFAMTEDREPSPGVSVVGGFCIVVDKGARGNRQLERLHREGLGISQALLGDLELGGPPEKGRRPIIGPSRLPGDRDLEPVRVVGWRKRGNEPVPLLHAKLVVCCVAYRWEGEMGGWEDHLLPMRVWMGSANWTHQAHQHLEFGVWITDPALAESALEFIADLVKVSEPLPSQAVSPIPEFVEGEWDDNAFAELAEATRDATVEEA